MNHVKHLLVGAVLFGVSACTPVKVTQPIGDQVVPIEAEDWEGLWRVYYGDDPLFYLIEVIDPDSGVLRVTSVESEPGSVTAYLRESDGWMFASYGEPGSDLEWIRIERTEQAIKFWFPDFSRFVELVRDGLLPGIITVASNSDRITNVTLTELRPEHLNLITSGSEGVLFEWEEPGLFVRLSDEVGLPSK